MRYRTKSIVVEAECWSRNNPHFAVTLVEQFGFEAIGRCPDCGREMREHGKLMLEHGKVRVCEGDWLVLDNDQLRVVKDEEFRRIFEPAPSRAK